MTESYAHCVTAFSFSGDLLNRFGYGTEPSLAPPTPLFVPPAGGVAAPLQRPRGVALDRAGKHVFVVDSYHRVCRFSLLTGHMTGVVGKEEHDGDGQPGLKAPHGVLECEDGSLLVASSETNSIVRWVVLGGGGRDRDGWVGGWVGCRMGRHSFAAA